MTNDKNEFNPDWDGMAVMVKEQQRMAKRIEELEAHPKLRRGDVLRCIETNELCTVWATSTTGKTLVKWKANDFGSYTAEQIGDLFWVEPKQTEPEPVAYAVIDNDGQIDWTAEYPFSNESDWPYSVPLYTAPPQREWQGLTDEEISIIWNTPGNSGKLTVSRAIEAKLKEKNT